MSIPPTPGAISRPCCDDLIRKARDLVADEIADGHWN